MRKDSAMKILAIDLGKNKSVFLDSITGNGEQQYGTVQTTPQAIHNLLVEHAPDRVVIEAGPAAGWVCDGVQALGIEVQVANGNDERWHWKKVKRKTDRDDALKLAQMSEMGCLPTVYMPPARVRQWRSLIEYRHRLVDRRTAIKNNIRSVFERQGLRLPGGAKAWTEGAMRELIKAAEDGTGSGEQLWRLQLHVELQLLAGLEQQIDQVEQKLKELAEADERVKLVKTAPYVGPRLGEALVAILDDPHRFQNSRQVS